MSFDLEIEFAVEAVRRAARVTRRVQAETLLHRLEADATKGQGQEQGRVKGHGQDARATNAYRPEADATGWADAPKGVLQKADLSPVTVADFASQAVVARALQEAFGADPLVGEEDASALRKDPGTLELVTRFVAEAIDDDVVGAGPSPRPVRARNAGRPRGAAPTGSARSSEGGVTPESVCEWIDHGNGEACDRFWTLDPIDGTKGYLRREQYAVALALIVGGRVQVAALACPSLYAGGALLGGGAGDESRAGIIVAAVRGRGAFWLPMDVKATPRPLRVSTVGAMCDARFLRSVEAAHTNLDDISWLAAALGVMAASVGLDSQAKYAVLAGGHGDVLLRLLSPKRPDYKEMIWDQAAGSLIVEEAGGRVTDLAGRALDFSQGKTLAANRGVCVTNGHLHEAILDGLAAMKAAGAKEAAR